MATKITARYILSNDYVVEINVDKNIFTFGDLIDPQKFKVASSSYYLITSREGSNPRLIVDSLIMDYAETGQAFDINNWLDKPVIVEEEGPPAAEPPIIKSYEVEGRVADKDTQEPIQGIKVEITSSLPLEPYTSTADVEDNFFETKTDKDGNFVLKFETTVEEPSPDEFYVLQKPPIKIVSTDNTYGQEQVKPYFQHPGGKPIVKSSINVVQLKSFEVDLKKQTTQLQNLPQDAIADLKNQIPKDPFGALQKAVMSKVKDIIKKFIPLIIAMIAKFGISKLTEALKNKFKDFNKKNCPSPEELKRIIKKRNRIVKVLNSIFKFVDALVKAAGLVLTLIQIFKLVKNIVVNLPIPQAVGTPPAKDFGGLIASQPMSATLKNSSNLDQFEKFIAKYEGLTIMVLAVLSVLRAVLKMAIDLLKGLDGMIGTCAEDAIENGDLTLEEINKDLLDSLEEGEEEVPNDPFLNGFELSVVEDYRVQGKLKPRYAVAKNQDGVVLLKGESSYSASDQILIDELKFRITQNDLKAY